MTRINTNVSSLVAQNTLGRSNAALNEALTRLSTGLRINTGKDDPAGLIASENLRSDITSIKKAITNTDRANQVIATADSALGQVSGLLNDIRGLVTEAANTGALSPDQIAANQLQLDSSLEALNRIAQTTTFQGRRLLDGSLDFITSAGTGFSTVSSLKIDQANLGASGQIAVSVDITSAATKAQINNTGITAAVAGAQATDTLEFSDAAAASAGTIDIDLAAIQSTGTLAIAHAQSTADGTVNIALAQRESTGTLTFFASGETLNITTLSGGNAAGGIGGAGGGVDVLIVQDGTNAGSTNGASYSAGLNRITVNADVAGGVTDTLVATAIEAINGGLDFDVTGQAGAALAVGDAINYANVATGGRNISTEAITLTGIAGSGGNATFAFVEAANGGGGTGVTATANGGGSYTIELDTDFVGGIAISDIAAAIAGTGEIASAVYGGSASYFTAGDTAPVGTYSATGGSDAFTDNLIVTAKAGGNAEGSIGATSGGIDVVFIDVNTTPNGVHAAGSGYDSGTNVITLAGDFSSGNLTTAEIRAGIAAIGGGNDFTVTGGSVNVVSSDDVPVPHVNVATGGRDASTESIAITGELGAISNFTLNFTEGVGTSVTSNGGGSYTLQIDNTGPVTLSDIATAIAGINGGTVVSTAVYGGSESYNATFDTPPVGSQAITGGRDAGDDIITVTADAESATPNNVTITFQEVASHGAATAAIVSGNIVVTTDTVASTSIASIASAINNLAGYSASVTTTNGDGNYTNGVDDAETGTLAGGIDTSGGLDSDIVFEISGETGAEVLSFQQNTSLADIIDGINAVSDATGVSAVNNGGTLELNSVDYGSTALVGVNILSGDDNETFGDALSATRANGTDIVASVNGILANGSGNTLSINTATLDLTLTVDPGSSTDVNFTITGGGALFQLGPDVVSNQQARIGITSVNTAKLGGTSGRLFQLGSGGSADLTTDTTTAAEIVGEAINQVTSLRGRLGAFQRTSLETNKNALNDTLVNLTEAESQIRDADFAAETANLTRAQILVQSGTTVLQITNQNPQNVLALLR